MPSFRSKKPKKDQKLVEIGDIAPDFEAYDSNGKKYCMKDFRGQRVLLSFFRFAA